MGEILARLLAETTFILGLNPDDKLHEKIMRIMELRRKTYFELAVSAAAILEATLKLRAQGEDPSYYDFLFDLIQGEYGDIKIVPVTLEHVSYAYKLLTTHGNKIGLFDCIHIATAYIEGYALIVRDNKMKQVLSDLGIYYIDLDKPVNEILADIKELSQYEQLPYGMLAYDD